MPAKVSAEIHQRHDRKGNHGSGQHSRRSQFATSAIDFALEKG